MSLIDRFSDLMLTTTGRIGRRAFLVGLALWAAAVWLVLQAPSDGLAGALVFWLTRPPLLFVLFCLMSQRLHDIGRAGWWGLPIVAALAVLSWLPPPAGQEMSGLAALGVAALLLLWPGQRRFNRYGVPPGGSAATTGPNTA